MGASAPVCLEICASHIARIRNDIPYVRNTGDVLDSSFEAQSEAGVGNGTETSGLKIPPVILRVESELVDAAEKLVVVGFSFRASDIAEFKSFIAATN